jgi:hypothetical protein
MEHFPIVLIPPLIRRIKAELPPLPAFPGQPPVLPAANVQQIDLKVMAIEFIAVIVIGGIVTQFSPWLGMFLLVGGLMVVGIHAWVQTQSYAQRLKSNSQDLEGYYQELAAYSKKEADHQAEVAIARAPENVAAYQYSRLLKALGRVVPEDGQQEAVFLSPAEEKLAEALNHYFPNKIYLRPFFSPAGLPPHVLDFAYVDPALNLRIDVEVDEPYDLSTGEPKHCLHAFDDQAWNELLLNKGWIVIRFSAQQVMQEPTSCCKAIAAELYKLVGDPSILQPFAAIPDLKPVKHWTEAEARQMATENSLAT